MWKIGLIMLGVVILSGINIIGLGSLSFRTEFNDIAGRILSNSNIKPEIVTEADLYGLPVPVQRYLRYTGILGMEKVCTLRLRQKGHLRQTPEDSWKSITAVQYYSINPDAFIWLGRYAIGPFSIISARDSYIADRGRMFIKFLGSKTICDVQGEKIDYSSLVRYLNEMMWFPTAFLNDNIHWDAVDDNSARVTIVTGDQSASAVLYFDKNGALLNFVGERYHEVNGVYVKDIWETPMTAYGVFNGLNLPVKGEAVWKMDNGDFPYISLEITDLQYNIKTIF